MSKNKFRGRTLAFIIVASIFIFISIKIVISSMDMSKAVSENIPPLKYIPEEYLRLFGKQFPHRVSEGLTYRRRGYNDITVVNLDSGYHLIIYKTKVLSSASLASVGHFSIEQRDRTTGEIYSVLDLGDFEFQFIFSKIRDSSQIYFTSFGDSVRTPSQKNDSMIYFHQLCNNFSLRYNNAGNIDLLLMKKDGMMTSACLDTEFLFLKKNQSIFFIALFPGARNYKIPSDLLLSILSGPNS